eukprot:scaffold312538_cov21-Tisochrysis_lutea.AAC.1
MGGKKRGESGERRGAGRVASACGGGRSLPSRRGGGGGGVSALSPGPSPCGRPHDEAQTHLVLVGFVPSDLLVSFLLVARSLTIS